MTGCPRADHGRAPRHASPVDSCPMCGSSRPPEPFQLREMLFGSRAMTMIVPR